MTPLPLAITMGDPAGVGGQGDQVHAVEFVAGVAPGVAGGVLDHS